MNTRLLNILADFLDSDAVALEKFNLVTWIDEDIEAKTFPELERKLKESEPECGYTACAIGWACTLPEFKEAGLRYSIEYEAPYFTPIGKPEINPNLSAIEHLAALFDLPTGTIEVMFLPGAYEETKGNPITPKRVAKRIRRMIRVFSYGGSENA